MEPGVLVGNRFEILSLIGQGEFGPTYAALDQKTGKKCAVKCLSFASGVTTEAIELFQAEAGILRNLAHPQIPDFVDFVRIDEGSDIKLYLVQEFIEGRNLRELIEDGKSFDERGAIQIALSVLDILIYLHAFSPPLIHKDIKPSNILLGPADAAYLVDFNAAREKAIRLDESLRGKYGFVPPEQYKGLSTPATDLYSLGMTLFYLLSHKEPAAVKRNSEGRFDYAGLVNISKGFLRVLLKMTAPDPRARYESAAQAKEALLGLHERRKTRVRSILISLVLAAVILSVMAIVLTRQERIVYVERQGAGRQATPERQAPQVLIREVQPQPSAYQSDAAPVIYLGFDNDLGGRGVRISSPRAQVSSGTVTFIPGRQGIALHMLGGLEYVQDLERDFRNSYTVQFWLKIDRWNRKPGSNRRILRTGLLTLDSREDEKVIVFAHFSGGGHFNITVGDSMNPLVPDRWHHLAFVKDHLRESFYAYRDGVPIGRFPRLSGKYALSRVVDVIKLGQDGVSSNDVFEGGFDEFAVYDYARSPEQISRDAGSGLPAGIGNKNSEDSPKAPDPGITVEGKLFYGGESITSYTNERPSFWFRDEVTGRAAQDVKAVYENGAFRFSGLKPGRYGVQVWINAESANPNGYPGDYETWHTFLLQGQTERELEIDLMKVMRLTSPQDNWAGMTRWDASCEGKHSFQSPVLFSWDSLGPGVEYRYAIDRREEVSTMNTSAYVHFSPSDKNSCHSFRVAAFKGGKIVGRILTHGVNGGLGWDYVFRVE